MSSNRVVYLNWIADSGRDPDRPPESAPAAGIDPTETERLETIKQAVAEALDRLTDNEREFIERYHIMGCSYREIAERSGRTTHKLEALHRRALRKLRKQLAPLVKRLYGLTPTSTPKCPICASPERGEIDRLIETRDRTDTWRPVMKRIRQEFGITMITPQTLIGHEKYH